MKNTTADFSKLTQGEINQIKKLEAKAKAEGWTPKQIAALRLRLVTMYTTQESYSYGG